MMNRSIQAPSPPSIWEIIQQTILSEIEEPGNQLDAFVEIYLHADREDIQIQAKRAIVQRLVRQARNETLFQLATAPIRDQDLALMACLAFLDRGFYTAHELEAMLCKGLLSSAYRRIATHLLKLPDISLNALTLIQRFSCCEGLLEDTHLQRMQMLRQGRARMDRLVALANNHIH